MTTEERKFFRDLLDCLDMTVGLTIPKVETDEKYARLLIRERIEILRQELVDL